MKSILLASQSPRRKELIQLLPWSFEVCTKEVEENIDNQLPPEANVQALAHQKALAVAQHYTDRLVIGTDTIVCYEDKIMGKPKNEEDARKILRVLSGNTHQVYTGVAIICKDLDIDITFYEATQVTMQHLSSAEIEEYLGTNESYDKAGAYGIQGYGARYISGIQGDYYNVVGLPVHALYKKLKSILEEK